MNKPNTKEEDIITCKMRYNERLEPKERVKDTTRFVKCSVCGISVKHIRRHINRHMKRHIRTLPDMANTIREALITPQ